MCHPWDDLKSSLPPMDTAIEGNIISILLMDINKQLQVGPGRVSRHVKEAQQCEQRI
jgi:hypothetical protein